MPALCLHAVRSLARSSARPSPTGLIPIRILSIASTLQTRPLSIKSFALSSSNTYSSSSASDPAARVPLSRADPDLMVNPIPYAATERGAHPSNESIDTKRARLVYMSRKRGIKETDLLLSTFAKKYIAQMDNEALDEFDFLMEENDWDIYYWSTGVRPIPEDIANMSIMPLLIEHCKNPAREVLRMPDEVGGLDVDGKVKI